MWQIGNCVTRYSLSILMLCAKYQEAGLCGSWEKCDRNLSMLKIFKVASNRKLTCGRLETALHDTVVHTDALCQISGSWSVWFLRKMWQKFVYVKNILSCVEQEVEMWQIGNCYTIHALCQISGSWLMWFLRKMWQKILWRRRLKWSLYVASANAGRQHNNG